MISKIRILLIEDNRLLRDGITAMINGEADMKVVAASGGGADTLLKARTVKPHVVLIDLGLRNQNGVRLVASLSKETPKLKVIGMGLIPTQLDIVQFVQAGASGFILKDATVEDFLTTIRSVANGEKVVPPLLTHSLFSHVAEHAVKKGTGRLSNAVKMANTIWKVYLSGSISQLRASALSVLCWILLNHSFQRCSIRLLCAQNCDGYSTG